MHSFLRQLPPAGGFPALASVVSAFAGSSSRIEHLSAQLGGELAVTFTGSGREAIFRALATLKSEKQVETLYLGAYSCPDIVSSAVQAGVRVKLLDLDPRTLHLIPPENGVLDHSVILFSNLYGLRDQLKVWDEHLRGRPVYCIDDRCQLPLLAHEEKLVFPEQTFLVYSFGRGKAFCGVGGGALCAPRGFRIAEIEPLRAYSRQGFDLLRLGIFRFFQDPSRYWIPNSLPFLKIGETHYERGIALRSPSVIQLLAADVLVSELREDREARKNRAQRWKTVIGANPVILPLDERGESNSALIRFPILVPASRRARLLERLSAAGLGATASYPSTLPNLCGSDVDASREYNGAELVAQSIVTLPIHAGVQERDFERAAQIIYESLK